MRVSIRLERPSLSRATVAGSFALGTTGLLIVAFDSILFDRVAIVGAAVATLAALALILLTGWPPAWLGVGAAWVYGTIMEAIRGPNVYAQVGLSMVFAAFAVGALGAYTVARHDGAVRL